MPSVELSALVLVLAMLVIGWGYLIARRRSLPRMWALLTRKPHATRRAHILRQLVFNIEGLWVLVPGLTAMLLAMLLGLYLVDVAGWPDVVGVAVSHDRRLDVGRVRCEARPTCPPPWTHVPRLRNRVGRCARPLVREGRAMSKVLDRPVRNASLGRKPCGSLSLA
jgi:hypothetical protein